MLEFICPTCGKRVQGDDAFAGKHVVCPGCNATMTAPGSAPPTSDTAIAEGAYPPPRELAVSTDGAFSEGLLPPEPSVPSLRKAAPHFIARMMPYLVVLAVVVTLVALLVPSVEKVRESAARTQSANNLKQISLCFASFHDVNKRLPFNGNLPAAADDPKSGSWAWQILPYIDSAPMFHNPPNPNQGSGIQAYMCPGRGRQSFCTTGPWTDYAINPWVNDHLNGAANAPDIQRTKIDITDGTSNTIFVGHGSIDPLLYSGNVAIAQSTDIFKGGDPALARRSTTNQHDTRGDASLTWGGPFPQGALIGMGDGTVRMFPYSMAAGVIRNGSGDTGFARFLTPTGGEAVTIPE